MSEEERTGGGSGSDGKRMCSTSPERGITYKRRKRSSPGSESVLQGEPSVSSGGQKAMEVSHVFDDGIHEMGDLTRVKQHWKAILEETSRDVNDGSIWSCIQKALASSRLGPTGNLNACTAQAKYIHEGNGNLHGKAEGANSFFNVAEKRVVTFSEPQRDTSEQVDVSVITKKCQHVLLEVLVSEKFAFLCNLLLGNFPGIKASSIIDFSQMYAKMKNETYGHSVGHFHQDLQQVWERIKKIGQEMALLAACLLNISRAAFQKQGPNGFVTENTSDSHTTTEFPYESEPSTKPERTEVSCLYKVSICKQCGTEADGKCSLICDGCEATYHFTCVKTAVQGIPTQNWYCSTCTKDRKESTDTDKTNTNQDSPHQNCVVCDRLKLLGMCEQQTRVNEENATKVNHSRESADSFMDSEGPPEPSRTALLRLCKICGTSEDNERKFIECGHSFCLYKYYHIRCLKTSQVANQHQHHGCWYCASCLCGACMIDKDDDMIVMCDGCDEAYHTYCMKPPRTSVPEGKWYCVPCNILRAKEGMRRYERWVLQQHGKSDGKMGSGSSRSMDMLLNAAEVETVAATRKKR